MRVLAIMLGCCTVGCAVDHPGWIASGGDSGVESGVDSAAEVDGAYDTDLPDVPFAPQDAPSDIPFPDVTNWDGGMECAGYPRCEGDVLLTCEGGTIEAARCALRCRTSITGQAQCHDLRPINLGPGAFEPSECPPTRLTEASWDTNECTTISDGCGAHFVTAEAGFEVCVVNFSDFELTGVLSVRGDRGLVIVSAGDLSITGSIDGGAHSHRPGPGGGLACTSDHEASGPHAGSSGTSDGGNAGGTGGGAATLGGQGGQGGSALGEMSTAYEPTFRLSPVSPSSGGGCGGGGTLAAGGAGGGVIHLVARHVLSFEGEVLLGGGGAQGGADDDESDSTGAGGGGGSGGNLLLEAGERVVFGDDAHVWLSGGGGGGGAGCLSDGNGVGANGESGRRRLRPVGGHAGETGECPNNLGRRGGDGGGAVPGRTAVAGENGVGTSQVGGNGGGGGGGLGMLVVRSPESPTAPPEGSAVYFDLPAEFEPVP